MQASAKRHRCVRLIGIGLIDRQYTTSNPISKADTKIKGINCASSFVTLQCHRQASIGGGGLMADCPGQFPRKSMLFERVFCAANRVSIVW